MKQSRSNLLHHVFQCSPNHIFILEPGTATFLTANEAATRFLQTTRTELAGKSVNHVFPQIDHAQLQAVFESLGENAKSYKTLETIETNKNGQAIKVELYLCSFIEEDKRFIMISATDKNQVFAATETFNAHTALYNSISDAIVTTDINFVITSWNKYAEELFGYSALEAIGETTRKVAATEYFGTTATEVTDAVFTKGSWKGEVTVHNKQQVPLAVYITISVLKNSAGEVIGTVSTLKDMRELKRKDERIGRLAEMVNQANDVIISVDKDLTVKSWNKGAERIYGYSAAEMMGQTILTTLNPTNTRQRSDSLIKLINEVGHVTYETLHEDKFSNPLNMLVSITPLVGFGKNADTEYLVVSKDITQLKHLQNELEHEKQLLEERVKEKTTEVKDILNRITDGFLALDPQLHCTYANDEACRIADMEPGSMAGRSLADIFPDIFSHKYFSNVQSVARLVKAEVEAYIKPVQKWIHAAIYPSENGLSIYLQDVTENKKISAALQASEDRYKNIFETVQEGLWQIDTHRNTVLVNSHLCALFNCKVSDVVGKSAAFLLNDTSNAALQHLITEAEIGISQEREVYVTNKEGVKKYLLVKAMPLKHQQPGLLVTMIDITKRRETEAKLDESEKRFRALIENSSDGVMLLSANKEILYVSPSGQKKLQYRHGQLEGSIVDSYMQPGNVDTVNEILSEVTTNVLLSTKADVKFTTGDGGTKWIELNIKNALAEPYINAFIVNFRDVSSRKLAEKQLKDREHQLSLIYNSVLHPMCLLRIDGKHRFRYETINTAYSNTFGVTQSQVLGRYFGDFMALEEIQVFFTNFNKAANERRINRFLTRNTIRRKI